MLEFICNGMGDVHVCLRAEDGKEGSEVADPGGHSVEGY
jgi:hypothetical protein